MNVLCVGICLLVSAPKISATDPRIVYVGRFTRDSNGRACDWPASEVRFELDGQTLTAEMEEKGNDRWQVIVDGTPTDVIAPSVGTATYTISAGSAGKHEIRLVKRTEAFVGVTRFLSFGAPGGKLLKASPKQKHLEIVGDSISCGYGDEGTNANEHFKPETENAYLAYGSVAARKVDADVDIIAWSGRKMWPDNTTPSIYDQTLATDPATKYDFKGPAPDAILINLATNDFGRENPDKSGWTEAYEAFVKRLWSHYPKARVYAASGSMMTDAWPAGHRALSTLREYLDKIAVDLKDPRFGIVIFEPQRSEDGIGSDYHPSVKTQEKMGIVLADRLHEDLGW